MTKIDVRDRRMAIKISYKINQKCLKYAKIQCKHYQPSNVCQLIAQVNILHSLTFKARSQRDWHSQLLLVR